jgi:predicted dehydrogenase
VIRVGIVGTGFSGAAHVEAVRRIPGAKVVAIAGSRRERGREAAARLDVERSFGDYRALVAEDDIDAVHNCTPNHLHAEVTLAALEAGKHVLSEKPLGIDSSETARLVEAAAGADAVAGVCFNYRHYPLVRELRDQLAGGRHGAPLLVHGHYLQDWLLERTDWNWRLEPQKSGSTRAVADIGSHWVDLAQHVTGRRVEAVAASLTTVHPTRLRPRGEVHTFTRAGDVERDEVAIRSEDAASALLRLSGGLHGVVTVSQVSAGRKNRLWIEVDAAQSALQWDQEEPNRLWIGRRDDANRELVRDAGLLSPGAAALAHYPGGHQEGWPDGLKNLIAEFYAAVAARRDGAEPDCAVATFAEAHHVQRVVEAIARSHEDGGWVAVEGGSV